MPILAYVLFVIGLVALLGAGTLPAALPAAALLACVGGLMAVHGSQVSAVPAPSPSAPHGTSDRLALMATSFVLFLVITAVPLPSFMDSFVGHQRAAQNELARQAIADAGRMALAHTEPAGFSISRDRAATGRILLLVIAAFAVAAMAARIPAAHRETFVRALVVVGTVIALAGFAGQWLAPQGKTLWWIFPVPHGQPVGGFLNRNHFGGFVALLCPAALALLAGDLGRRRFIPAAIWALCFMAMTVAVVMSHSRGAWLAYAAAIFAVAILFLRSRRPFMLAALLCLLAVTYAGISRLPSGEELEERAKTLVNPTASETARMRLSTWRDTLRIVPDYAFLGTGANAFRMVFPQYRTATTRKSFKHAENEYLQIPAELGLIGTVLLVGLGVTAARRWFRNQTCGTIDRVITVSAGGALIVAATHALFDFAIRIPLYAMVLAALAGLLLSPAPAAPAAAEGRHAPRRLLWLPALGGFLVSACLALSAGRLHNMDSSDFLQAAKADDLCRALNWSPTSWQAWYHLGRTAMDAPDGTGAKLGEYCMSRAADYDPNNYRLWRELCLVRLNTGDTEGAREAYSRLKSLRTWQRIEQMERQP